MFLFETVRYFFIILGSIFPEEFYSFLRSYFSSFATTPVLTADEKIAK